MFLDLGRPAYQLSQQYIARLVEVYGVALPAGSKSGGLKIATIAFGDGKYAIDYDGFVRMWRRLNLSRARPGQNQKVLR